MRKSQSVQVNGSASGRDDIGPDLLQRYDVTGFALCRMPRQANTSAMRRRASREDELPIDFFNVELSYYF